MIEKIKSFQNSDRAVSPVIGVILMVAITVILAAVIGAFVLDIGNQQEQTPQASITFSDASGNSSADLRISHDSGDTINLDDMYLTVDGDRKSGVLPSRELSTGESVDISVSGSSDSEVVLVHEPSGGTISSGTVDLS